MPSASPRSSVPDSARGRRAWRRLARRARLAGLAGRRSADVVVTRVARRLMRHRRAELDRELLDRSARDVARELGQMKGAVMKLGQMASFLADDLPPDARQAMGQLQAEAPPMPAETAAAVVRRELGGAPEEVFARWDPVPVAAASIGQVHRATLADGRDVAVKVQYPGIDDALRADLADAERVGRLLRAVTLRGVDVAALAAELRDRMADELDYEVEARNQQRAADAYAGHPRIHVPSVVASHSTRRVLTSEWVDGWSFAELVDCGDPGARATAAEAVFRFAQGSILRAGTFNADPHPGNYRFAPDGSVTFLDFGLVKHLDSAEHEHLMAVLDAVLARDAEATAAAMVASGFLAADHGLDPERVFACVSAPYRAYLVDEFTFTPAYVTDALGQLLDVRGPYADVLAALDMPPSFVLLDRVVWGVSALLGRLAATGPWRAILAEYRTDAAAATPMGEAEVAWAQAMPGRRTSS